MNRYLAALIITVVLLLGYPCHAAPMPGSITIAGTSYTITYPSTNARAAFMMATNSAGGSGWGTLHFRGGADSAGRVIIGTNTYLLSITSTQTNVTYVLPPPPQKTGQRDSLTNDTSQTASIKALLHAAKVIGDVASPTTLNIMVLYSPAAVSQQGSESAMQSQIQAAITEANDAYQDSGLQSLTLNLVFMGPLNYTEAVPGSLETDLLDFEVDATAHSLRAQYGADMVFLVVNSTDPEYAGMSGGYNGNPNVAYDTIQSAYIVGNFVLAHEVGHNLGCDHDRANQVDNHAFSYSYGSRFTYAGQLFRSVMAYDPGIQVGYFSGPNVQFMTNVTGDASDDNADTIAQIAPIVATFHTQIQAVVNAGAPTFTQEPTNEIAVSGSSVIFSPTVTGTDPITYQWFFNDKALSGQTGSTLTLNNVKTSQTGNYMLLAENSAGTNYSTNAALTVDAPVVITKQPANLNVQSGASPTLSVSVTGTAPITYQWYDNNGNPLGTGSTCKLSDIQDSQAGSYTVTISNPVSTTNSTPNTVSVLDPVTITQQPTGGTALGGQSFMFTAADSGSGTIINQWYFNNKAISGATGSTLTLNNLTTNQSGNYKMLAANAVSTNYTAVAALSVYGPVVITKQPAITTTTTINLSATITVTVTGSAPITYQWYDNNGNPIANGTNASLKLTAVQTSQAGGYYVAVSNGAGTVSSDPDTLVVLNPPVFTQQPVAVNADTGAGASFTVAATGGQPQSYQWYQNGAALPGATDTTLTIASVTAASAGTYYCNAANSDGSANSYIANLSVNDPPVITVQPKNTTTALGGTAEIYVGATGAGTLSYTWYDQNQNQLSTSPALVIPNVSLANEGTYTVNVANYLGNVTSTEATLHVSDPPVITVQPVGATNTAGQPATLTATATGRTPMTYIWKDGSTIVGYGSDTNPTFTISDTENANNGSYTVTITNIDGKATSLPTSVLTGLPVFKTQPPTNRNVNVNGNITLSVTNSGTGPMSYQWHDNGGNPIPWDYTNTLIITNIQLSQAGGYYVTVSNPVGSTNGNLYNLTVKDPPVWIQEPQSQSLVVGGGLTLTAIATTVQEPISYQWYQGKNAIDPTDPNNNGTATTTTLTLTTVSSGTAGNYTLQAWDADATNSSAAAIVTVPKQPPVLLSPLPPASIVIAPGEPLQISLNLGGWTPTGLQWFLNNKPVAGQNADPLAIATFDSSMAGSYTASITNSDGHLTTPSYSVIARTEPPVITSQPASLVTAAGGTATFSVSCANQNNLGYQWLENQIALGGQNNATLVLNNVQDGDAGVYSVIVTDPYGTTESGSATLRVADAPTITTQPQNLYIPQGSNGTLSVTANATVGATYYQWQENGNNISGTGSSYTIHNATTNADGAYDVLVYNSAGTNVSNMATVTVGQPPTISQQPTNICCLPGTSPVISVTSGGGGDLNYQWYCGGILMPDENATNLALGAVEYSQTNAYTVKIWSEYGSVLSMPATITVMNPPTINTQPVAEAVLGTGQTFRLTCPASGNGGTLTYQWYLNDNPIAGATNASYTVPTTTANALLNYSVIVANQLGASASTQSDTASVTILSSPAIKTQPANVKIALGAAAQITMAATGDEPLTYYWLKDGVLDQVGSSSVLTFDSVSSSDLANYSVIVSNAVGTATSAAATLSATNSALPPGIAVQPQTQTVASGKTATFSVTASGQTPLSYQWYLNGNALSGATAATLAAANITASTFGQSYYVVVSNHYGAIQSQAVTTALATPTPTGAPPTIVSQPYSYSVVEFQTLDIPISVSQDAVSFNWYKNGTLYEATATPELVIASVPGSFNNVKLTMSAYNGLGYSTSAPVVITIYDVPVITAQPVSKSGNVGGNVTLSVSATGTGPLQYQWYDNGGNPIGWDYTNSLIITNIQAGQEGDYSVSINNSYGQTNSYPASVWVKQPPVIDSQPAGAALNLGDSYTFSVDASAGRQPMTYVWYHNKVEMPILSTTSITIASAQNTDAGNYYVIISNPDGSVTSSNATLTVASPPFITSLTTNITVKAGTNCTLTATVTGTGPLTYQWFLNESPLAAANSNVLKITGITDSQEGIYTLTVNNAIAGATANVAVVIVADPPVITQQPVKTSIALGQTGAFTVANAGRQPCTYQWYENTTAIDQGNPAFSGANGSTLIIDSMATNLVNKYKVTIVNADGSVTSASASLVVDTNNGDLVPAGTKNAVAAKTPEATVYNGLFYDCTNITWDHSGAIQLTMVNTNYIGVLTLEDTGYPFAGTLVSNKSDTLVFRTNNTPLGLNFDLTNSLMTGVVGDVTWRADLNAVAQTVITNPPVSLSLWLNDQLAGVVSITNNTATLTASLAGDTVAQACTLDATGQWPLYTGNFLGWLQATPTNLSGTLVWFTPSGTNQNLRAAGGRDQP